jgi:YYY domain-containing protein
MIALLSWYAILTVLGWLTFPLAYRLFPALADRGYSLSRAAGLLIWAYVFWLCTSLGVTQNTVGGILFGLLAVLGLSLFPLLVSNARTAGGESSTDGAETDGQHAEIITWVRNNLHLVVSSEVLFFIAFAFLAWIRAGNPTLDNAEKPMELMFINSILRSPSFPPHDSWLSGYAISYYYFGYVMTDILARLAGITGSVAHNLMTALVFALAAVGAHGILYNLLAPSHAEIASESRPVPERKSAAGLALLAPLFLLLVSNVEGFLEVLHRAGIFWSGTVNFWTWLGIKDLNEAPLQPLGWIPDRFWWWWRASRVVSDFDLAGNFREVIDEFPFFSFLHADLHPHVLAIPFNLLAIAIALNLFLGGWRGQTTLFGLRLKLSGVGFFAAAITLGGLAFLNTWDILVGTALIVLAYTLAQVRLEGWSWGRLKDTLALGVPLVILAVVLYLPFYFGFSSQAGGILPNLTNPTRSAQLWVMFGPLFVPVLAYLLYLWRGEKRRGNWRLSVLLVAGLTLLLWAFSWALGWLALAKDAGFAQTYLGSQGTPDPAAFFSAAMSRRFSYIGGLLSMLALLVPALAFLIASARPSIRQREPQTAKRSSAPGAAPAADRQTIAWQGVVAPFIFMLIIIGALLVLAPEFVFLRDQFASRLNTIFKFYYQAWLLLSLAAAFGVAFLLQNLRGAQEWIFRILLVVLLVVSLTYPALGLSNKTEGFHPSLGWTLDDFVRIERGNPDEAAGILWLRSAPDGVVAEAVGGSYTGFGRISEYTGLPAVLGWPGHESQWRGTGEPQGTREADIADLYSSSTWDAARAILSKYAVRYVYIGGLERSTYTVQEDKFRQNLSEVFHRGDVVIYEASQAGSGE